MPQKYVVLRDIPGRPNDVGEVVGVTTKKGFNFLKRFSALAGGNNKGAVQHEDGSMTIHGERNVESFPIEDFNAANPIK